MFGTTLQWIFLLAFVGVTQFYAAGEWERLLWRQVSRTSQSYLKIGFLWGGLGVSLLALKSLAVHDPDTVDWMRENGLILGFVLIGILTATWVAWCIVEQHNNNAIKVFNLLVVAAVLTFNYPAIVYLKTGAVQLYPAHLLVFASHMLSFAAVASLATVTLGFSNLSEMRHRGKLAAFASHPRTLFTLASLALDVLWMSFQVELVKLGQDNGPATSARIVGLGGDGSEQDIMLTALAAGIFAIVINAYSRQQALRVQDKLAWHSSEDQLPANQSLLLQNTSLIKKALNLTDVAMVTWHAPESERDVGTSDLRSGTTFISPGPLHDAGLNALGSEINLPDFWKASIHPDDLPDAQERAERAFSDPASDGFQGQWRFRATDGSWLTMRGRMYIQRSRINGLPVSAYGIHTNVSEETLANEVLGAAKMRQLNALRMISHDLRGSMGTVLMASTMIERLMANSPVPAVSKNIERIRSATEKALDFLNDAVTYARTEDRQNVGEPVLIKIHDLLADIVQRETARFNAPAEKVEIQCPQGAILIDVLQFPLTSVLTNLISNGIKYTPDAQGKVRILVKSLGPKTPGISGCTLIEVSDDGVGIPPAFVQKMFSAFSRAENVGSIEGFGLGMAILSNSVQILGAQINVISMPEIERGSVFTLILPNALIDSANVYRTEARDTDTA